MPDLIHAALDKTAIVLTGGAILLAALIFVSLVFPALADAAILLATFAAILVFVRLFR